MDELQWDRVDDNGGLEMIMKRHSFQPPQNL